MSSLITGLVGGAIAALLSALALRNQRKASLCDEDWRTLRPGWFLHGTFIGCCAFVALAVTFLLGGGSSLPDAETQNLSAVGILASFALMAAYLWWIAYARSIAWKDGTLRVRWAFGRERLWRFAEVSSVKERDFLGDCRIRFTDGSSMTFSLYVHGAEELRARLPS